MGAVLLSIALSSQVLAATWSTPVALTSAGDLGPGGGLVTLGTSTAVAVYARDGIIVKRSTNSGQTWSSAVRLADGVTPSVSGRGQNVDLVWRLNERIRYTRSGNYGKTFGASIALSPTGVKVAFPSVARGPDGLVVAAWMQAKRTPCCDSFWPIFARVSTNGGNSFAPAQRVGFGWQVVTAVGKGVVYVAIDGAATNGDLGLVLRRSLDAGATWNENTFPWAHSDELIVRPRDLSMTAGGKYAYVAYQDLTLAGPPEDPIMEGFVGYRRTSTKGASWSAARSLTPPGGPTEHNGVVTLESGVLHAAFRRSDAGVWYTRSSDGLAWSAAEQAVARSAREEYMMGVGKATRLVILYSAIDWNAYREDVFVVTGTP